MILAHNLGFPRIGLHRELKWALERYWKKEIDRSALEEEGRRIRTTNWALQVSAGQDFLSVGDFAWYDHVLGMSTLLGVIPARFGGTADAFELDTYFRMARGRAPTGKDIPACEMTKWFDTNYHYIVPELSIDQEFKLYNTEFFTHITEAKKLAKPAKPILLGPLSYLWLSKTKESHFDKLTLLPKLLLVYQQILARLEQQNIEWVQIDEPILVLDLPAAWQNAFREAYQQLQTTPVKQMLTTYFGSLGDNTALACSLPTEGLHIDLVRGADQLPQVLHHLPADKTLSAGIIDGRNIWRADLRKMLDILKSLKEAIGERLWISSSCSLLHSPMDLRAETKLDPEIKSWLAFAIQKLYEITILVQGLRNGEPIIAAELEESNRIVAAKKESNRIHSAVVKERISQITPAMTARKHPFRDRQKIQQALLDLPLFPTTTIGSFPQTAEIRQARQNRRMGKMDEMSYREQLRKQIAYAIRKQLDLGIDVLVHGEAERTDMVEHFGELLEGFAFTHQGWVQSYGSRCVKPPIIFGDVSRAMPMTVEWISYAQSLTEKPVKGMLTGPITILCWSFVRDDQPRFETAKQIALALRDEVNDLAAAGIRVIQIDEPAVREGLPLRQQEWESYLQQAVYSFRLASCCVADHVQIHTHMCYAEFNDIIEAVAELDADVITIETSRSDMELLKAFEKFHYPNDIGPGVYDIHSPRIPTVEEIVNLMDKAAKAIPLAQLWVNPDCGLKTRDWPETETALKNMVTAAHILRKKHTEHNRSSKAYYQPVMS